MVMNCIQRWTRYACLGLTVGIGICTVAITGCNKEIIAFPTKEEKTPKLIGSSAAPYGLEPMEVMGYGVVVGLPGTGGNIPQGPARSAALGMLNQKKFEKPTEFLASKEAAVVLVMGKVAAGSRNGDTFDIELKCLDEDRQTTSLQGGYLLFCSLKDVADVSQLSERTAEGGSQYRSGFEWAIAEGPVMIKLGQTADHRKGRVVAGARLKKERQVALMMRGDYAKKAEHAMRIGAAIDERFRVQSSGNFAKIADPKDAQHILLRIPDQYRSNVARFLEVLGRIPYEAGSMERNAWQQKCGEDLLDPDRCFEAAVRLEAIGTDVTSQLAKGCKHDHMKVRFAAAESLAYLGNSELSADVLAEVALRSPELRSYAITALAVNKDSACSTKLRDLLSCDSIETRYAAFVAMRTAHPTDPSLRAFHVKDANYCLYDVGANTQPMIHVSTVGKPEIVIFGKGHQLLAPCSLVVGADIVVNLREGEDECTISVTDADGKQVKRRCSSSVNQVLATTAQMGASYADLVDLLRQASENHCLSTKLAIDGMPKLIPWSQLARADLPVY
jgi:flagellar basal body P-ring protein FlgI